MDKISGKKSNLILVGILTILFNVQSPVMALNKQEWKQTTAEFSLIFEKVENLKLNGTVLSSFIEESGQKLDSLLENDSKTLISFKIQYLAPIKLAGEKRAKNRTIIQYGLYKTLDPEMQRKVRKDKSPIKIEIQYLKEDPILIQFILDKKLFPAPVLLTDTIDSGWVEK